MYNRLLALQNVSVHVCVGGGTVCVYIWGWGTAVCLLQIFFWGGKALSSSGMPLCLTVSTVEFTKQS